MLFHIGVGKILFAPQRLSLLYPHPVKNSLFCVKLCAIFYYAITSSEAGLLRSYVNSTSKDESRRG
jgi:hypothetical protein